ncbi:hypothetical protein F5Y15DRAFT_430164 [Xylariaceae sp. FL0016]|nr:hypothetical protein F5Y15DRAFT_430164 [Xylariaceae sp. FL0016]
MATAKEEAARQAAAEAALLKLLTAYDNSAEPKPTFNYRSSSYGILIFFMLFSWICVSLRIYTRLKLKCLGWDDFFVIMFRISGTIGSTFICLLYDHGFGQHFIGIGQENMIVFQMFFYVALLTYTISTTLMKLCLLIQYLRVFEKNQLAVKICWAFIGISAAWGLAFTFIAAFPCFPISGFWNWLAPANCYGFGSKIPKEIAGTFAAHTATNVILDIVVLTIPLPIYFRKCTLWKQRVGLGVMVLLGLLVNLVSIWRLQTVVENKAGTYPVLDPTWYGPKSIVLAAIEVDLASVVASVPIFWPIVEQTFGKIFVTQEVHVTHHHRRLSNEDQFELQPSQTTLSHRSQGSEASLALAEMAKSASRGRAGTVQPKPSHYKDEYVMNRVIPLGLEEKEATSEAQVVSEGQRGFRREQRERFGIEAPEPSRPRGVSVSRKLSQRF